MVIQRCHVSVAKWHPCTFYYHWSLCGKSHPNLHCETVLCPRKWQNDEASLVMCHLLEHFDNVTALDACLLSFSPWYIFMDLNCSIWVAQLMEFYSAVLFCRKLAPVPTEELQYTHGVLARRPRFALLLHLSILLSAAVGHHQGHQAETIWGLQTLQWQRNRPVQLSNVIILVASNSLYHCTILLFFTSHCVFGFCVLEISCCVSSVFPWSI